MFNDDSYLYTSVQRKMVWFRMVRFGKYNDDEYMIKLGIVWFKSLDDIRFWIYTTIHCFLYDMITRACINFKGVLAVCRKYSARISLNYTSEMHVATRMCLAE